jgi:hypothetical protein
MDSIEIGSEKERDRDKRGMMYDRRASTSMRTGISELDEDDEGKHGKGNGREREDEKECVIVNICDDTGMAPESPLAVSYTVSLFKFPFILY